ncbi:MAG: O-methyltransferase [Beijerinckiaceae bacterium]
MQITRRFAILSSFAAGLTGATSAFAQRGGGRRRGPAASSAPPLPADDFERNALAVLDSIDRNQRYLNVGRDDGRLLRMLVESGNAKRIVELGTSTGYSGIWLALGLKKTGGKLTTFEIDRERAAIAGENFKRAGVADIVEIVVGDAHTETKKVSGTLDMVFSDADKEGYLTYFRTLAPLLRKGGLFVSDNMRRPSPEPEYVKAITTDPAFDTVFINMESQGTGISLKKL